MLCNKCKFCESCGEEIKPLQKVTTSKFPIWETLTLGLHKSPESYEQALESNGFKIGDWTRQILKKIVCEQAPTEIQLGSATVAELGLPKGGTTDQLHAALRALGLELCPAEVGPALRLLLKDQPKGEWLWLAMEAIASSDDDLRVFGVGTSADGLWLFTVDGHPGRRFDAGDRVVFAVPAQVS